jgi:hypothetical protein
VEAEISSLRDIATTPFDQVRLLFDTTKLFLAHYFEPFTETILCCAPLDIQPKGRATGIHF